MSKLTPQQLAEYIDRNHQVQLAEATERLNELIARLGYEWRLVPIKRKKGEDHGRTSTERWAGRTFRER